MNGKRPDSAKPPFEAPKGLESGLSPKSVDAGKRHPESVSKPVHIYRNRVEALASVPFGKEIQDAFASKKYRSVLDSPNVEEAMGRLRAVWEKENAPETKGFKDFLQYLKSVFVTSERSIPTDLWEGLKKHPPFKSAILEFLKETVPQIFKNRYNRSLYEDIEFGLFLLGSDESFDVLSDIRNGEMLGISSLFAKRHSLISQGMASVRSEEIEKVSPEERNARWEAFERNVSAFEQLCEIINKIAAIHSISALDKERAFSLARMITGQIDAVENDLDSIEYDPFVRDKLLFLEGKLLGNYSHLKYFDGRSEEEILGKAEKICEDIRKGFEKQRRSRFGGNPKREDIAVAVMRGNIASVMLAAVQKIERLGTPLSSQILAIRQEWTTVLFELYAEGTNSAELFTSAEGVVQHFLRMEDHDEFAIETVHHLVLFSKLPVESLCRLVTHLIGDNQYHNVYHEEFKIKLFTVILDKLRAFGMSDRAVQVALWIREYARKNERASGMVLSFSQLHLALALFLAGSPDTEIRERAMECYLRAMRVADEGWQLKFEKQKAQFLGAIGGEEKIRAFETIHSLRKENGIFSQFLSLIAQSAHDDTDIKDTHRKICSIIEEFFYDICTAEIRVCKRENASCARCLETTGECRPGVEPRLIRRGNLPRPVAIAREYYLLLQYPSNLENTFNHIFKQRKDFIQANLASILQVDSIRHELKSALADSRSANERLDLQTRTDPLTGLPNMRQYEMDAAEIEGYEKAVSLLIKIENLNEINDAYGLDIGDQFIKEVANGLVREFFGGNARWKIYHMGAKEFLVVGNHETSEMGTEFSEIVRTFHEICSSFEFHPKTDESGEGEGVGLRAKLTLSYADGEKQNIYKKLHIAMEDARKNNRKIVAFDSQTHSEERARKNLEGGALVTKALREGRVIPYYQPIVDNLTGEVAKHECLGRLVGTQGEIIPPGDFIDHVKRAVATPVLTRLMLERICENVKGSGVHFSINISWQDLSDPDLMDYLEKTLVQYGIEPNRVTIEILEEAIVSESGEYGKRLAQLKKIGCRIALDDFGWESSNFSRFEKDWWPDFIKIDKNFIQGIDTDE